MARTNIRADVPVSSPEGMLDLSDSITTKHETYVDPANPSPVEHLDMATFKTDTAAARALHNGSKALHTEAEGHTQDAYTIIGIAEGQTITTEGTLYFDLDVIKKELLTKHINREEQLQKYDFNVVMGETRGRRTIRVDIPVDSPDGMLDLCEAVTARHEALGGGSPITLVDMAVFKANHIEARTQHNTGNNKHKEAEGKTQDMIRIIGTGKGQKVNTEGTLYYIIGLVRDTLLAKHKNHEEQLEQWGFNIVITETLPNKPDKRVTIVIAKGGFMPVQEVKNGSSAKNIGVTNLQWCASEDRCTVENANSLAPDEEATMVTGAGPYGTIAVVNISETRTGRIRMTVKK
jgi:hypothetical protein